MNFRFLGILLVGLGLLVNAYASGYVLLTIAFVISVIGCAVLGYEVVVGTRFWKTIGFWETIETREEALSIIKQVAIVFYGIAAFIAVGALVVKQPQGLFESFLSATCAIFLQWKQSRVAAVLLFLGSAGQIGVMLASRFGLLGDVRANLWTLPIFVAFAWVAFRAAQATFKLRKLPETAVYM